MSEIEPGSYYERTNRLEAENKKIVAETARIMAETKRIELVHYTNRHMVFHVNFRWVWLLSCTTFLLAEFMALVL